MHYIVRKVYVSEGSVRLKVAASDVVPVTWFDGRLCGMEEKPVFKQFEEVGKELYDGVLQFPKGSDSRAKRAYERCKMRHGTWRSNYGRDDEKRMRFRFARDFARRMCV